MSELKPCPFCGKMPEVEPNGDCYCDYYICPMAPDSYMPKDWNTRPIEDELRSRIAELEEQVWDLNLANEKLESAYFADETIAPDGSLKPSVCKLMKRVEKAETDYSISEAHVTALLNRIAELEAAQRWIPVSERLPDTKIVYDKFDVIVEFENIENGGTTRCVELMSYDYRNKSWNDDCGEYGFYPVAGVTHWRERPTLPESPNNTQTQTFVYGKVCEE